MPAALTKHLGDHELHTVNHADQVHLDLPGDSRLVRLEERAEVHDGRAIHPAVAPFRYLIVYPPLMRGIGQEWQADTAQDPSPAT